MTDKRILLIGYGNPGRADDGLGPALADRIEALDLPGLTVESDYQLSIEHAALAAGHDIVIFADADGETEDIVLSSAGGAGARRPVHLAQRLAGRGSAPRPHLLQCLSRGVPSGDAGRGP